MAVQNREIETLEDLQIAFDGSFYTICGAGGDLDEWVTGYDNLLEERGVGKPAQWFRTTGKEINDFAVLHSGFKVRDLDLFPEDLTILMFPIEGIGGGRLAMFKLQMQDRWFDDIVNNMNEA